jgi:hypothetical protein
MRRLSLPNHRSRITDHWIAWAILSAVALGAGGCVTRPKTYHAPDPAKFYASSKKLSEKIEKTGATIARAETQVAAAQKDYDVVAAASIDVRDRVVALSKVVPPEFLPEINQLLGVIEQKQIKEGELSGNIDGAYGEIEQAKKDNAASATAKATLESDFEVYKKGAIQNAADATDERNNRIAAEKQVLQQKLLRWMWRIFGVFILIGAGVLIFLWFTGKWTIKGATTAARAYLHV